ncbi:MAG: DNA methylase [Cytophagales bacterium CG12_big_fil_rev_8_21_14_0_65_40_12]|nr:MAG: DNA methylase [Cytophagales bacterium CG12_big_fil_rev_8_21_14_0_65_40_12]PIW04413.1 MAG: DNA methylase [Cytophagales bacterium CG17_big_fil_post_rev_8_21_14_2_50_40_13]
MNPFKPKITYDKELTEKARYLRNNSTLTEVLLWNELKKGKRRGYDFHRQKPILHWIVDFFCYDLMLAIEIDGSYHDRENVRRNDRDRQERIEALGITFLRFSDDTVKYDLHSVLIAIEEYIDAFEKNKTQL